MGCPANLSINEINFKCDLHSKKGQKSHDQNEVFFTLPYVGKPSLKFQRTIRDQMNKHQVSVRAAYKTVKVSSYFSLKDKCSDLFRSNVVYRFTCSDDKNSSYIGETKRHLFERIMEHCLKNIRKCDF